MSACSCGRNGWLSPPDANCPEHGIAVKEDPDCPGRISITMPDPRPTEDEMALLREMTKKFIREEFAKMRSEKK